MSDPLDEIMRYLGLADQFEPAHRQAGLGNQAPCERQLATRGALTLWWAENENAEWVELRGPITTFRATRAKANLLLSLEPVLEAWAAGEQPSAEQDQLRIRTVERPDGAKLEVRYKSWKPMRLCRKQALGIVTFAQEIRAFASSSSGELSQ